jgi:hypothetical protein
MLKVNIKHFTHYCQVSYFTKKSTVSRPGGFHPQSLAERCVSLSTHTAPVKQTCLPFQTANVRKVMAAFSQYSP